MTDDLGRLVSDFVAERVDRPRPTEVDLWCEAVYAALFSVAFEIVIRSSSAKGSPEDLERETNAIVTMTCTHAAPWVGVRLKEAAHQLSGATVEWDLTPEMRSRMVAYFSEAYGAMSDRGYQPEVARSHACFAILRTAVAQLGRRGLVRPDEASTLVAKIFEGCESMSHEIAEAFDRHTR